MNKTILLILSSSLLAWCTISNNPADLAKDAQESIKKLNVIKKEELSGFNAEICKSQQSLEHYKSCAAKHSASMWSVEYTACPTFTPKC